MSALLRALLPTKLFRILLLVVDTLSSGRSFAERGLRQLQSLAASVKLKLIIWQVLVAIEPCISQFRVRKELIPGGLRTKV